MSLKLPNTVINFHVIRDSRWMERILKVLLKHYTMVPASDIEDFYFKGKSLRNVCHITVDDGDLSVYTHLFPLIKKYQIPISIYVSPLSVTTGKNFWFQEMNGYDLEAFLGYYNKVFKKKYAFKSKNQVYGLVKSLNLKEIHSLIDGYRLEFGISNKLRRSLDFEQLQEMKSSGLVEIGAHTMHHPILKNEDDETVREEIELSISGLNELLNQDTRYFAYPNGVPVIDFDKREMDILAKNGIKLAFSTQSKNLTIFDHPLSVPRRGITKGGPLFVLVKLLLGDSWIQLRRILKGKQEPDFRKKQN